MCPSASPETREQTSRRKLFCLGDSLTFGYGVSPRKRWLSLAAEQSGWRLMDRGLCGDTTGGMMLRLRELLVSLPKPDAVLLFGGVNDIFYSGSDLAARANMGAMIHQLLSTGVLPLVGLPMPIVPDWHPEAWGAVVDFETAAGLLRDYGAWLRAFCRAFGVRTVDFGADFFDGHGGVIRELYLDGLHPGPEGHRRMAARLCETLEALEGAESL